MLEIKIPSVGESISEVQIGQWLKKEGEWVAQDENIVDLETEKASVQVPAPQAGILRNFRKQSEEFAMVGDVLCELEPSDQPQSAASQSSSEPAQQAASASASAPPRVMPAAQRILEERGISPQDVTPSGPGGRILKEDVLAAASKAPAADSNAAQPSPNALSSPPPTPLRPHRSRLLPNCKPHPRTACRLAVKVCSEWKRSNH